MSFLKPQVGKVFLKKTTGGQSVISPYIYIYIYIFGPIRQLGRMSIAMAGCMVMKDF